MAFLGIGGRDRKNNVARELSVNENNLLETEINTTMKNEVNQYLHNSYISDVLNSPLTGEILKGGKLQWFFPLAENKGIYAYDFSGNAHKASIYGNRMALNADLGLDDVRYLSRSTNDKLGKLNVFGERGIRAVGLPEDLSVAGKQTVTFQCVFEPSEEIQSQNLIVEATHNSPSGVTGNKLQIAYNFGGDNRILVGLRTKHPDEQALQIVKSTVIEPKREPVLLHVSINLVIKKVSIYINGELDSEHNLNVEEDAFLESPREPTLGNVNASTPLSSLRGQAGFFAMHENILTETHIQKQYQAFFKRPNTTEGGTFGQPITINEINSLFEKNNF